MERVLSLRELNRALLVRQLLLDRGSVTAVEAVERIAGMHAQWGPSPYVGLWSRVDGFRREELERAYLAREVLRATLMRGTVHLVSIADYGVFGAAVAEPPWLRRDAAEQADRLHHAIR